MPRYKVSYKPVKGRESVSAPHLQFDPAADISRSSCPPVLYPFGVMGLLCSG